MKINQVAAQLYTVRDYLKTPKDIEITLKKIRKIGYLAVQVSGMGPIPEEDLMKILKDNGLICCATHESSEQILNEPEKVVERLEKLKCKYTSYPYPANVIMDSVKDVKKFAKKLNSAGKVLYQSKQVLTYHNHHIEFQKVGEKTVLELIYNETNPQYLQGEIDTYWVQYGGGNPTDWCNRLKKRLPLIHLKDYKITKDCKIDFAEIGSGNLDWKTIIPAAEKSGCKWFIVEQDTCPGDPVDSLKKSFHFIQENLCI